jgi:Bardet-Biedl syndrome 9 protein
MYDVLIFLFQCRIQDASLMQMLEERANQYRVIQKRILTRFKDKTPASLQNLDALLDSSYVQVDNIRIC